MLDTLGDIFSSSTLLNDTSTIAVDGNQYIRQCTDPLENPQAGGDVTLLAMDDILNQGQISGLNVTLTSANGSIINHTQTAQRHAPRTDIDALQSQFLRDRCGPWVGLVRE